MRELSKEEILMLSGGKNIFSKVLNVVAGSLITGIAEGFVGFMVAGPPGFVAGFGHGAYNGAAGVLVYEGAMGLTETLHPELGVER